jgi:hypothetical protein
MMSVVDSRVRAGVLSLNSVEHSCQPTSVAITPTNTTGNQQVTEVLCGDKIDESTAGGLEANLVITAIQDFTDAQGLVAASWTLNGQTVPFEWQATNQPADKWTGKVTVQAMEVGGTVGERITSAISWTITELNLPPRLGGGRVIPTPAPPTPGATKAAAKPGDVFAPEATVTASDATAAALLTGLGFTAAPATAWTTGQKITVGTFDFHWSGTAWAAGSAT